MDDREYKKLEYRINYSINKYDYLVEENKLDAMLEYLKNNSIKNEGAYVFTECYSITVYTNKIHDRIIRKYFAFY